VGGAALDVFDEEPLPASSPWWTTPNTIITPHVAGYGLRYEARAVDVLLENVRRLEAGEALLHCVDRDAGY
jgi:phosphoglycerate dehydrogenase-like enzyme